MSETATVEEVQIDLPPLHPAQIEIAMSPARYKVIRAGRRFGKGVLGVGTGFRMAMHGMKIWWVTPSFTTPGFQAAWRLASEWAMRIQGARISQIHKTIFFPGFADGKGFFQFKSANLQEGSSLRGEGIDLVIVDEAAHIKRLRQMWEQELAWSLMDRGGGAWFISTPAGFTTFYELHKQAGWQYEQGKQPVRVEGGSESWATFHYPSDANPFLSPTDISELTKNMPAMVVQQERYAEFVQLAGALFKRQWFEGENGILIDSPLCACAARSWDLAWTEKTTSDYTAGIKGGMSSDGTLYLEHIIHGKWEWPDAVNILSGTALGDGVNIEQGIEVVGAQRGMLQTLLRDHRLANIAFRAIEVHKDKLTRALPLIARAEQRKLKILRGPHAMALVDEMCGFPDSDHDDLVDSSTGLLHMIATPGGENTARVQAAESGRGDRMRTADDCGGRTSGGMGEGGGRSVMI